MLIYHTAGSRGERTHTGYRSITAVEVYTYIYIGISISKFSVSKYNYI